MLIDDCVFCKIIRGEIPSSKVYEDDRLVAFLDIAPFNFGHVVIVPKAHHTCISNLPHDFAAAMIALAPKIGSAQIRKLKAAGFNILVNTGAAAGQTVQHCHMHVIPRFVDDKVALFASPLKYDSIDAMNDVAATLREKLAGAGDEPLAVPAE